MNNKVSLVSEVEKLNDLKVINREDFISFLIRMNAFRDLDNFKGLNAALAANMNSYIYGPKYSNLLDNLEKLTGLELKESEESEIKGNKIKFSQIIYNIINNISGTPKCPICGSSLPFGPYYKDGYKSSCSIECHKKIISERSKNNYKKVYGKNNENREEFLRQRKIKMIETNRRKYGVDFPTQLAEIQQKIVQTNLKKYGTERASQSEKVKIKAIQTNLERYGVENYTQTPEYLDKVKKTNLELYGVENVRQNKEIDAKARATTKKIYGVENVFYSEDFQEKIKKINKQNWGVSNPSQVPEFQEKINKSVLKTYFRKLFEKDDKGSFIILNFNFCEPLITEKDFKGTGADHYYKFKRNKCNSIFEDYISAGAEKVHPFCPHCESSLSLPQKEIFTFMKDHDNIRDLIKLNDKIVLNGREVDILINDLKLGIEIDGIFFHSSYSLYKFKSNEISKPINYHLDKSKNCSDKNLNLIHILDKEWKNNKELNKNFLNHILKCHENIEGYLINDPLNLSEDINKLIFNISDNSNLYNSFSINWYPENTFGFLEEKNIFYINVFYDDKELASFKVKDIEAKNFYIVNWVFKCEENSEYLDYKIIHHLKNFLKKEFRTFEDLFIINNKFKIGNFSYLLNNVYLKESEPPRGLVIDNTDHKFHLKEACTSSIEAIEETLQLYKNIFFDCGAELYKIL